MWLIGVVFNIYIYGPLQFVIFFIVGTLCQSSDPLYTLNYYIKWVTASWTYSICLPAWPPSPSGA